MLDGLVWPETLSQRPGSHGQIRAGERVEMRDLFDTRFLDDLCLKPGIWGRRELPIAPNVLGDSLVNVEIVVPQVKTAARSIGTAAEAVAGLDLHAILVCERDSWDPASVSIAPRIIATGQ